MKRVTVLFIIGILITVISGCQINVSDTSSNLQSCSTIAEISEFPMITKTSNTKNYKAQIADFTMAGNYGIPLKKEIDIRSLIYNEDSKFIKENIDQKRWIDLNGQKFEVKYRLSGQNENRSYDQYMGYNNGHALYVVYTPNTTNIHFFYSNDEFFQHSDIIISESEKKTNSRYLYKSIY